MGQEWIKGRETQRFVKYKPDEDLAVLLRIREINPNKEIERAMANLVDEQDFLGVFFKEVSSYPILNDETQQALARLLYHGLQAGQVLSEGRHLPSEKQEEFLKLSDWGREAKDRLIKHNLRLVVMIARKYKDKGGELTFSDLIQEGVAGFTKHIDQFDPYRGYTVSTYMTWWIEQVVRSAIADTGRQIRIPVHRFGEILRMYRSIHQLKQELGRDPKVDEIAKFCRQKPEYTEELLQIAKHPLSLETPVRGDEEDIELGDIIADKKTPEADVPSYVYNQQLIEATLTFLATFPERERVLLELRFGIRDGKGSTLEEIAEFIGLTRERIRQILAETILNLTPEQKSILLPYYDFDIPKRRKKYGKGR